MIIDTIENLKLYKGLTVNLSTAIDYIISNDLSEFEIGKHEIEGDNIFIIMSEYETKDELIAIPKVIKNISTFK